MRPPGWAAGSPPLPQPIGTAGTRKYKRAGCILQPAPGTDRVNIYYAPRARRGFP